MKTTILFISAFILSSLSFAQQTPTPPQTPNTSTSTSSTSTSSSYEHSVNDHKDENENLSIAVSESDDSYKLRAKFPAKNDAALKELLLNEFGKENLKRNGNDWEWTLASGNNEVYKIKLTSGKLRMELDKDQAASTLIEKFLKTGQEVKELLSGDENEKAESLQRAANRLQRDAERMNMEAKRLEIREKRSQKRSEVRALKTKAETLQQKVDSLEQELEKLQKK